MTFPNRNQAGSGAYARSLVAALEARADIETSVVSAPDGTNFAGTIRWLVRDAGERLSSHRTSLLHCPTFVTPWNVPMPFVTTVLDLSTRRFPSDYPLEWRVYERWLVPGRARSAALVIAISEATRRDVIAEYGVRPEKVLTIHPGIDQIFPTSCSQARRSPARTSSWCCTAFRASTGRSSTSAARARTRFQPTPRLSSPLDSLDGCIGSDRFPELTCRD